VAFDVAADAYDRFMGRYSSQLSAPLAEFAGIEPHHRVLDVGCGPGQLAAELVERVGAANVAAVDPSEKFVAAMRERHPGVELVLAAAEELPFEDDAFDAALAQLVVHFMADAPRGIAEMARVTKPGGVVAASFWDARGRRTPMQPFWASVAAVDVETGGRAVQVGAGDLSALLEGAGLREVEETEATVAVEYASFDEWWLPYTYGVGPAGDLVSSLPPERQEAIREHARDLLGEPPFTIEATALVARGRV